MKSIFKFSTLLVIFFTINISCKKNSDTPASVLPAATTEGKNTFGCLIDDVPFTYDASNLNQRMVAHLGQVDAINNISITISEINNTSISIGSGSNSSFKEKESIKINSGNYPVSFGQVYTSGVNYSSNNIKDITSPSEGEIYYTRIDTVNKVISGTFWFDAYDTSGVKIIKISDGRFDAKYY